VEVFLFTVGLAGFLPTWQNELKKIVTENTVIANFRPVYFIVFMLFYFF